MVEGVELGVVEVVEVDVEAEELAVEVEVEEEVVVKPVRSDDRNASWIMGANRLSVLTFPFGSVVKPKLLLEPVSQDTVGSVVNLARIRHVCPLRLSHLNPVGQHPTNVSSGSIWYCACHPAADSPATAVQADVYPAGHSRPGE
jgi:hypothetical protein